jgi:8-oxo-dGTP pyrophosphatase MutT (NUDIX family)
MKPGKVRPLAICVFRNEGRILVAEGYDPLKQQTFYRPLGGKIEFGEYGYQTIARELQEEVKLDVKDVRYLGTLENIFTFIGKPGHEIVLIYDGSFVDPSIYERDVIEGYEDEDELLFKAYWKPLEFFEDGENPLYPDRLVELLKTMNK